VPVALGQVPRREVPAENFASVAQLVEQLTHKFY
jgi:hypothetical protein